MRSMFQMGLTNELFWRGKAVGPMIWDLSKEEIAADNYRALRRMPVPGGWTGTYPYIVKVRDEGEYIVYADGSAQYLDYRTGQTDEIVRVG